jgi:miniconductance mechanosensitive channel
LVVVSKTVSVRYYANRSFVMNYIKVYIEQFIHLCGLTGTSVSVWRHIMIILIIVFIAWIVDFICRRVFIPLILKVIKKTDIKWDDVILNKRVLTAACHVIPAVIIYKMLPLAFFDMHWLLCILLRLGEIYITLVTARMLFTFINSLKGLEGKRRSAAQQYLITFCGVLKIIIIFTVVIVIASIVINKSPMTLFAGLGATATILMFVFKDTIVGFVSGIRLTSNDMLHKGDWITFPKAGANGIVEEVNITTVKVRNFDNTIITIPPQTLVDDSFQNWIGMQESAGRRVKRMVYFDFRSIHFATPELKERIAMYFEPNELEGDVVNMSLFRLYIERFISTRPEVNADLMYMVRQLEATQSGLPLEFYFFTKVKEWKTYEHNLAVIMEQIYALVPVFDLKIYEQYPNQ